MPTAPIYSYSVAVADTRGLDPQQFRVTLLVDREGGKLLSKTDREAIAAAFVEVSKEAPAEYRNPRQARPASPQSPPAIARRRAVPRGNAMATSKPASRSGPNARSGPSQPEEKRKNKTVSLRMSPEERAQPEALAQRWGLGPTVVRMLRERQE